MEGLNSDSAQGMVNTYPLVLFDGVCNYCNTMVNFAIRNNSKRNLRFATLQSAVGQRVRKQYNIGADVDSLVFVENNTAFVYAAAALRICRYLDWPAKALYVFNIFPYFMSNPVYKWIAKNRYKWFGKKEVCMIPTPEVRSLFLDDVNVQ